MNKMRFSTHDVCYIGIFTAIIAGCAQLSIPMPYGVPMTLQTFAIPLAGIVLGTKNGTISTLVYILLGAIGAPVFANFTGGLGVVLGPTGGFIISFPILALATGIAESKNSKVWLIIGIVLGTIINYLCGMLFFSLVLSKDLTAAFAACVLPFIPTAIIKIFMAAVLGKNIKNVLVKSRVLV